MAPRNNVSSSSSSSTANSTPRQPLKILMLHGYTQSGPLFRAKSRALAKSLQKAFPQHDVTFTYPTGPIRLNPADIPGYTPLESNGSTTEADEPEIEAHAWFRRASAVEPPEYRGLEVGLGAVAQVLRDEGPFDGIIGFSQGANMTAMVASLLESDRKAAFEHFADATVASDGFKVPAPIAGIPFPEAFEPTNLNGHPPVKFAICYSGFRSPGPRYRAFFENPSIRTPVLHVLGSLDAVVDESRSRALIAACAGDPEKDGTVVWHPGGHFLPSQRAYLDAAIVFVRRCLEGDSHQKKDEEEKVEDMDVPF